MNQNNDKSANLLPGLISVITNMVSFHDPTAAGHQTQVALLAKAIARQMHADQDTINCVFLAAQLHDIGKISIPSEILNSPSKLTNMQHMIIMNHAQASYDILKPIDFPWRVADVVLQHHERLDGSGYPRGLTADEISLESKILAVADVIEAMAAGRSYHRPLGIQEVVDELEKNKGKLYDSQVVDSYVQLVHAGGKCSA